MQEKADQDARERELMWRRRHKEVKRIVSERAYRAGKG